MVDDFLRKARDFFTGSNNSQNEQEGEYSDRQVRPASEDPYGDPADQNIYGNATPASQDPYGDPADLYSNAIPASQDPYGDPADQGYFGNVIPASEDPYGDPADDEYRS
ncbi:translation initiation factor [Nostoc sp. UHCC 0702]|nr:translation initiation factor [Nostoc sp. UHCC 0702]